MTKELGTAQKALSMLTAREKKSGLIVIGLILLKGIGDTISVATVIPFLALLGNPGIVYENGIARYFFELFGFDSTDSFIVSVAILIIIILVFIGFIRSLTTYALNRWVTMREYSLSLKMLSNYMRQPYEFFITRNSLELNTYIIGESNRVVGEFYKPFVEIINSLATFIMVIIFLLWREPVTTIISVSVFAICYLALYMSLKNLLKRMGDEVVSANKLKYRVSGEALSGIKQIKLLGREEKYTRAFSKPAYRHAKIRALNLTLRQVPKFTLETLAFAGIIILTLFLIGRNGGVENGAIAGILPTLGMYAVAGYRLLPTMQSIYASSATLRYGGAAVDVLYDDLNAQRSTEVEASPTTDVLQLEKSVVFENVGYRYPEASEGGLAGIAFEIKRGMTVGVVGTTGAGKTTLVDVLIGLLPASSGNIFVDGELLTRENVRQWQKNIGYVPQDVFLVDASIKENIALGVDAEQIDEDAVRNAAAYAQLQNLIETELPEGYDTEVGERGVRLSGGQKQRIGIARALYYDPEVIVFDEATSALDNATERQLMKEIEMLSGTKTIVMIAHRLSTVKECDVIFVLDKGQLVGCATYDQLLKENSYFQSLTH